jgi:AraC-like DNA-binding protein
MSALMHLATTGNGHSRSMSKITDYDECRTYIHTATGTHRFVVADPSQFRGFLHYPLKIGRIHLDMIKVDAPGGFEVIKEDRSDQFYFQFLLNGHCAIDGAPGHLDVEPGEAFVIDPKAVTREMWRDKCQQLLVRVSRDTLEQSVARELGKRCSGRLEFRPTAPDCGIAAWLRLLIHEYARIGGEPSILMDERVATSLERTILSMLLSGLPHSKSEDFNVRGPTIAPYYVKRAEEYIRNNAENDIRLEDIVTAAGVSERSLFYGFKRWRRTTPMAYVQDLRLQAAHAELKRARQTGKGTVSQAAVNAGFTNFSHFSTMYKARFGESPSVTLRGVGDPAA